MGKDHAKLSLTVPSTAFTIFCGVMRTGRGFRSKLLDITELLPWQSHVFQDNCPNIKYNDSTAAICLKNIEELNEYYYPGFVKCLFPKLGHEVSSDPVCSFSYPVNLKYSFDSKPVTIQYIDLFFFPDHHLVYCFKCTYKDLTLDEIVSLNNLIRNKKINELEFIYPVIQPLARDNCLNIGNKLKMFLCLSHELTFSESYSSDHLLFDLATCSPVGTSVGEGKNREMKPSREYFENLMKDHRISVFDNWTAVSLFDTFTLVHRGPVYNFNWEFRYFRILYVHSLFVKTYLAETSKAFYSHEVNKSLEEEFYDFDKHFNFKQISYNFLPQIIYEKIRYGLNVEQEMKDIRSAIEKDHRKRQERREIEEATNEKRINYILFALAFLTVIETVWHGSEWLYTVLKGEKGLYYNIGSITSLFAIYFLIFYMYKRRKDRSRE
ncbi:MAG: hypothetical protein NTU44_16150 [Bacteroidetes bacterium]|nr:hypothetical protein [Bacteroidota bacterium]